MSWQQINILLCVLNESEDQKFQHGLSRNIPYHTIIYHECCISSHTCLFGGGEPGHRHTNNVADITHEAVAKKSIKTELLNVRHFFPDAEEFFEINSSPKPGTNSSRCIRNALRCAGAPRRVSVLPCRNSKPTLVQHHVLVYRDTTLCQCRAYC